MEGARSADVLEIEAAVRDALALHGIAGSVTLKGSELELHGGGAPVAIDVGPLVGQWPLLPASVRERRTADLARRLVAAVRGTTVAAGSAGSSGSPARRLSKPLVIPMSGVALAAVLGLGAWLWYGANFGTRSSASAAPSELDASRQTKARKIQACEAARRRVYAGASMGPFFPEGWVAELWLARWVGDDDLAKNPAIVSLLDNGKLAPGADAALAGMTDGAFTIESGIPEDGTRTSVGRSGVTLRFAGSYASAFFDPAMRPRFLALADRAADAVSADAAALYARCEHLRFHDVGVWFRGSDRASVAAALVYGVGAFATIPALDRGALEKHGPGELEALHVAASRLDASTLSEAVGSQGGAIKLADAGPGVSIVFPLLGETRAISASRSIARRIGVGVGGP